jgi:hypothetical protein
MSYTTRRFPMMPSGPGSRSTGPVLSVGQRVFVHCPGDPSRRVAVTDDADAVAWTAADGAEVEIVAWKPRGSAGTRYRVQATSDRREGWLTADALRSAKVPAPPPAPATDAPAAADVARNSGRRFGSRRS